MGSSVLSVVEGGQQDNCSVESGRDFGWLARLWDDSQRGDVAVAFGGGLDIHLHQPVATSVASAGDRYPMPTLTKSVDASANTLSLMQVREVLGVGNVFLLDEVEHTYGVAEIVKRIGGEKYTQLQIALATMRIPCNRVEYAQQHGEQLLLSLPLSMLSADSLMKARLQRGGRNDVVTRDDWNSPLWQSEEFLHYVPKDITCGFVNFDVPGGRGLDQLGQTEQLLRYFECAEAAGIVISGTNLTQLRCSFDAQKSTLATIEDPREHHAAIFSLPVNQVLRPHPVVAKQLLDHAYIHTGRRLMPDHGARFQGLNSVGCPIYLHNSDVHGVDIGGWPHIDQADWLAVPAFQPILRM